MNLKVEHGIIAILLLAFLYYFYKHQSLLSDLFRVPDNGNPQLKAVKWKHCTDCMSNIQYGTAENPVPNSQF